MKPEEKARATEVRVEQAVNASPETVWNLVTDVTRMGEWSPEATGATWVKGATGPAVGARFKGTNRNGGKTWSTNGKVVVAAPGRVFAFEVTSGPFAVATWRYSIEAGDNGCIVTETWIDQRNGLVKRLGKMASGVSDRADHNRRSMEETLAALAATAESAPR